MFEYINVNELLGKTLVSIKGCEKNSEEIIFETSDRKKYRMFHDQDCCESVTIDDICGNIEDLLYSPLLMAEEEINLDDMQLDKWDESFTWTFYKFATNKGYVTIKWYGTSNGYYSERVSFEEIKEGK